MVKVYAGLIPPELVQPLPTKYWGGRDMILSEFVRVVNMGWIDFGWGILWAIIIFLVCNMLILAILIPAIYNYILKNIMPELYEGKLKIALAENKRLNKENQKVSNEYWNLNDRLRVIKKSVEG